MLSPLLLGSMGTGLIPELAVPIGRNGLATTGTNPKRERFGKLREDCHMLPMK